MRLAHGRNALDVVADAAGLALNKADGRLIVLGLCGAQGSGKSTIATGLAARLESEGVATAILSIDDLYKTRAARQRLARTVHPLLLTRGVPGTHDVALGMDVIAALERGEAAWLPRFDKAADDRLPPTAWDQAEAGTRLLILEGWCVGARQQAAAALAAPVNVLEREEDSDGVWRRYANAALAGAYQRLFARIDLMVLLAAPDFGVVQAWRAQQERALRAVAGGSAPGTMSDAQLARFIQHYERLTNHILDEMPGRADLVIRLDADRSVRGVELGR